MPESSSEILQRWVSRLRSPAVIAGDLRACRAEVEPLSWGPSEAQAAGDLAGLVVERAGEDSDRAWGAWLGARAARFRADFPAARRLNALARRLYRSIGDESGLANCDLLAGAIATEVGDLDRAARAYRAAEKRFSRLGDGRGIAACTYNRGLIHFRRAEFFDALRAYEAAREAFLSIGRDTDGAICTMNIGNALDLMGRHQDALDRFKAAQEVFAGAGDDNRAARCRLNAGNALAAAGKQQGARRMFAEAREVFQRLGDDRMVAACLLNEAELGPENGADLYREALAIFERIEDRPGAGECELALSSLEDSLDRAERAHRTFLELGDRLQIAAALRRRADFAADPAPILEEALSAVEAAVVANPDFSFRFLARKRFADLVPRIVDRLLNRGDLQATWQAGLRAGLAGPLGEPDPNEAALQIHLGESSLVLLLALRGERYAERIQVGREEVLATLQSADEAIRRPHGDLENLIALGDWFLSPVWDRVWRAGRLRMLPGPFCGSVPFAALPIAGGPSIDQVEIVVSDRASGRTRQRWSPALVATRSSFGSGLVDLPATEQEGQIVAGLLQARHLHGGRATVGRVKEALAETQLLHIATHALDAPANPASAALLLEPDAAHPSGLLYGREIAETSASCDLVVLSACGTDRQPESLAQAFLASGVGSVLASGWRAHDEATVTWMDSFYRAIAEGAVAPAAHRRACRDAMTGPFPDPHFWALWKLLG